MYSSALLKHLMKTESVLNEVVIRFVRLAISRGWPISPYAWLTATGRDIAISEQILPHLAAF